MKMSKNKSSDPLVMEIKAEMGEGKDKATISASVKGGFVHAEITFPSARLPDLMTLIDGVKFTKIQPERALLATTKKR
jgi:hypothetical protein